MKKRIIFWLFLYQLLASAFVLFLLVVLAGAFHLQNNQGSDVIASIFGVVIGTGLFVRRQEKKNPGFLEPHIKKLSLAMALINVAIFVGCVIGAGLFLGIFKTMRLQGFILLLITVTLFATINFLIYYFGTKICLKHGIRGSAKKIEGNLK